MIRLISGDLEASVAREGDWQISFRGQGTEFTSTPARGLGLMQVGTGIFPIPVIPVFGAALASGDADLAFAGLAAFTVLTLVLNARPPVPPREREASASSADPG